VQIEFVEGCNRLCSFCGLNGIRDAEGSYRYMTEETATRVASNLVELCPTARIEFAMHGEPTMHPKHLDLIRLFRGALPRAQMQLTTNGKTLMKRMQGRLERVFEAGIDFVILDTYYPERDALREEASKLTRMEVRDFYDELAPAGWSPWHNHGRKVQRFVVLMDDIGARDGEVRSRTVFNHAGSNPTKDTTPEPLKKTCTLPFRELSVTWNGNVNICCMDWKHEYTAGNANVKTLGEIWYGPEMEAARTMLQSKDRAFGPCKVCDVGSGTRAGLLPKYPQADETTRAFVREVERKSPNGGNAVFKRRLPVLQ
jgi:hypothetical protein